MFDSVPNELKEALPGTLGALVATFFVKRPLVVLIGIFAGGCALSYYASPYLAKRLGMLDAMGLVGFLLGMFGMSIGMKLYDFLQEAAVGDLWKAGIDALRKRLGVGG